MVGDRVDWQGDGAEVLPCLPVAISARSSAIDPPTSFGATGRTCHSVPGVNEATIRPIAWLIEADQPPEDQVLLSFTEHDQRQRTLPKDQVRRSRRWQAARKVAFSHLRHISGRAPCRAGVAPKT